jgi:hypothetical protein
MSLRIVNRQGKPVKFMKNEYSPKLLAPNQIVLRRNTLINSVVDVIMKKAKADHLSKDQLTDIVKRYMI